MSPSSWGLSFNGPPFVLFGATHLLALGGTVLACLLVALITPRLSDRGRDGLRWAICGFCVANWLGWDLWQVANGVWSPAYSLPLHLCTLSVPVAALMLATRNFTLFQLLYFWGFAGATQAMLTPDLQANGYNFPHFRFWIFFTSHGSIYLAVVFAMVGFGYRPTWRSILVTLLITNLLLIPVGLVNWLTGGNYMYVARKPEFASLIDLLGPWPWYILAIQAIAVVAFVLVYLPYAAADWARDVGRARRGA